MYWPARSYPENAWPDRYWPGVQPENVPEVHPDLIRPKDAFRKYDDDGTALRYNLANEPPEPEEVEKYEDRTALRYNRWTGKSRRRR